MAKALTEWCAEVRAAAAAFQEARTAIPAGLYRLDEIPEMTAPEEAAWARIREVGDAIHASGGDDLMEAVYAETLARDGWRAVKHVRTAWNGVGGWTP